MCFLLDKLNIILGLGLGLTLPLLIILIIIAVCVYARNKASKNDDFYKGY